LDEPDRRCIKEQMVCAPSSFAHRQLSAEAFAAPAALGVVAYSMVPVPVAADE
jgi:hypothetical protein